jgi:hypothetical protein
MFLAVKQFYQCLYVPWTPEKGTYAIFSQLVHWLGHSDHLKIIVLNHVWQRAILTIFKSYGLVDQTSLKLPKIGQATRNTQ